MVLGRIRSVHDNISDAVLLSWTEEAVSMEPDSVVHLYSVTFVYDRNVVQIDMTSCQGVMLIICTSFFICGILLALIIPLGCVPWMHAVFAVLGAIMFSMFLAIDTQLLMGKKCESISPEDYIYGTLNIYLDIVYIFSFLEKIGCETMHFHDYK